MLDCSPPQPLKQQRREQRDNREAFQIHLVLIVNDQLRTVVFPAVSETRTLTVTGPSG